MKPIVRTLKQFLGNTSGNIGLTFAAAAIPMIGLTGAAMDYARLTTERADLAQALDSAVLSAAIDRLEGGAATTKINEIMSDLAPPRDDLDWSITEVSAQDGSVEATLYGSVDSSLMKVVGIDELEFIISSAATSESKKLEVVLSLDNTGSMGSNGKMDALIAASHSLLDALEPLVDSELVQIGMVPFITTVNVAGSTEAASSSWIDVNGDAQYNGYYFEGEEERKHHLALFEAMNVEWAGCVEARPEPYDVNDTAPNAGTPDTLWVPYMWPDPADNAGYNDYLDNPTTETTTEEYVTWRGTTRTRTTTSYLSDEDQFSDIEKYYDINPGSVDAFYGPNAGCPMEVTDLTTDVAFLRDQVDSMEAGYGAGTNVAQGMVWGWRMLSPEAPFTRGAEYDDDEVQKILIVLTDGVNVISSDYSHHLGSAYTSYGFIEDNRLGTTSINNGVDQVNQKMEQICQSVKDEGIIIYSITFQISDDDLEQVFKDCATVHENYYNVTTNEGLSIAFNAIAEDLGDLRLTK